MPMHSRKTERKLNVFEKYLTVWVILCIIAGIGVGRAVPGVARYLDGLAIYVNEGLCLVLHGIWTGLQFT